MAWNQSTTLNNAPRKPSKPAPSWVKGALAGLLVVVLLGIAAFFIFGGKEEAPKEEKVEKKSTQLAEVTPSISTNGEDRAEKKENKAYADMTREEKLAYYRAKYGDSIPDNLKATVYFLENPPQKVFHPSKPEYDYFKHRCERRIAAMLMAKPGTFFFRPPEFDSRFDDEFQSAAIEKVEILDDDAEDVKELKRAVQETKDELIARAKAGEKVSDIMNAEAKTLYDLGMYRHELQNQIAKVSNNPDMSDDDVRDFVKAANQMLEKKGAAPLRSPSFMFRQASLAISAERRKKSQNKTVKGNK